MKKVAVHSGGKHAMALTVDGRVFSWGEGDDGKLGHCSRLSCDKPRIIEALKSKRVRDISCGSSHSAAITSSGELFTWGCGEYGRLGHGDNVTQWRPKQVKHLSDHRVVQVACGSRDAQTLALTDDGMVGQQVFAGEATRLAYMTDEAKEGRDAFLEKRKPNFKKFR